MPHTQYSPRKVRRHVITYQDVCGANNQVTAELAKLGFWHSRLDVVQVWWVPASWACYGWYQGDIFIPALNGANLSDLISGSHTRLTDVLRHEWAHAVADHFPRLMNTARFARVFGGDHDLDDAVAEYDPASHLTCYASTRPCEDFAEVFHYYLRHKGRLPIRLADKPHIVTKWRFIEWLAERISSGAR